MLVLVLVACVGYRSCSAPHRFTDGQGCARVASQVMPPFGGGALHACPCPSRPVICNACLPAAFPVALSTGSASAGVLLLPVYLRMHQLELACPRKLVSIGTYVGSTKASMTRVRLCPPAIRSWWIAYPLSGYVRGSSDESPRNLGWHHTSQMRIQLLCTGSHGLVMVAFQWRLVPFPYPREFPRTLFHGKATDESTN